jgi:DNA-binding transcriptional LysR family regulator
VISSEGARLGEEAARRLARTGQREIGPGLTDAEFARIERDYDIEFADDHRAFLAAGLPLNRAPLDGLDPAEDGLRIVNREPGAQARRLLDAECRRLGLKPDDLLGYDTQAAGHLQVASAIRAGLAAAGIASEPAARAYGLAFVPLADEHFSLVIPAEHAASREVQALLKVLSSPWLPAQLASLPGYDAGNCGECLALGRFVANSPRGRSCGFPGPAGRISPCPHR